MKSLPLFLILLTAPCFATDWPQYRGPSANGTTDESLGGPFKQLWKIPVGTAFGSFAIVGDKAFYFDCRGPNEVAHAVDANTGKEFWSTPIDKTIYENEGGNGPRTTPAIADGRVFLYSTYLKLVCLDADSGKPIWSHDIAREFGRGTNSAIDKWGNALSPLLQGDRVVVAGGGRDSSILAFEAKSGKLLWKTGSEIITQASPTPATIGGVPQVIFWTTSGLVSVDPQNGRWLWSQRVKFNVATAASPVVGGDVVYCSAGYGTGAHAFRITKNGDSFTSMPIWEKPGQLVNLWSTPIYHDGYLYGLYGFKEFRTMPLKCIELKTGREIWSQEGFGQGGLILAGDKLLIQGDTGQLVMVKATPAGYQELGRIHPLGGKCWQMPIFGDGKIITRSDKQAVCLSASMK